MDQRSSSSAASTGQLHNGDGSVASCANRSQSSNSAGISSAVATTPEVALVKPPSVGVGAAGVAALRADCVTGQGAGGGRDGTVAALLHGGADGMTRGAGSGGDGAATAQPPVGNDGMSRGTTGEVKSSNNSAARLKIPRDCKKK